MTKLINLHVFENKFTGSIPTWIDQLPSLEVLFLSSNSFNGTIPSSLGNLSPTLRGLYLSDNKFQGQIPDEVCSFGGLGEY
jgi:Leucine-rich repeat (LRR) protein